MDKVYIVSKRIIKQYANSEPWREETVLKVFRSYDKVVKYIYESIKIDHECLDREHHDTTNFIKHNPDDNAFKRDWYIYSITHDDGVYHETVAYKFVSYDVE